jgi:hypothetical protein
VAKLRLGIAAALVALSVSQLSSARAAIRPDGSQFNVAHQSKWKCTSGPNVAIAGADIKVPLFVAWTGDTWTGKNGSDPASTALPATLSLFATGLGALGLLVWLDAEERRKSARSGALRAAAA